MTEMGSGPGHVPAHGFVSSGHIQLDNCLFNSSIFWQHLGFKSLKSVRIGWIILPLVYFNPTLETLDRFGGILRCFCFSTPSLVSTADEFKAALWRIRVSSFSFHHLPPVLLNFLFSSNNVKSMCTPWPSHPHVAEMMKPHDFTGHLCTLQSYNFLWFLFHFYWNRDKQKHLKDFPSKMHCDFRAI